ncbi:MAG: amidohydrolase family protein [Porticoccaceae bacterium]|nr:amidohydrolase family protein [Porticoccaceae bacterium]
MLKGMLTIIATISMLMASSCAEQKSISADTLFINGVIYTADSEQSVVSALAIKDDILVYAGDLDDAEQFIDVKTDIVDLKGKMIIPGLHDAHIHLAGIVETDTCDLASQSFTLEALVPRLKKCINRLQLPSGDWLTVEQWAFSGGNEPSVKLPTIRKALDAVSTKHPIVLLGNDGHHGAVNSHALKLAADRTGNVVGLNQETLNKEFATFKELVGVDSSGEPNGMINEDARKLVNVPNLWGYPDIDLALYQKIGQRLAASGITSTMEASLKEHDIDLFAKWAKQSPLTHRMTVAFFADFEDYRPSPDKPINIKRLINEFTAIQRRHKNVENLKIDTAKIFVDGVTEGDPHANPPTLPNAASLTDYLQPQFKVDSNTQALEVIGYVDTESAACIELRHQADTNLPSISASDFYDAQGFSPLQCRKFNGVYEREESFIRDYTLALYDAGINVHSHAIGDRAVRLALDSFAEAKKQSPKSKAKVSMAHAQLVHPSDISRIADLDVYMAFTYSWIEPFIQYQMMVSPFIDPIMSESDLFDPSGYAYQNSYPAGSVLEAGGVLVAGSDAPVEARDPRPMLNIEKAVTRKNEISGRIYNKSEAISVRDILDAYTINGAAMLDQQDITGSLEVGKKADFVVLSQDLLKLEQQGESDRISETQILSTWFEGREIYAAPRD